jgi:hypothetical protein
MESLQRCSTAVQKFCWRNRGVQNLQFADVALSPETVLMHSLVPCCDGSKDGERLSHEHFGLWPGLLHQAVGHNNNMAGVLAQQFGN